MEYELLTVDEAFDRYGYGIGALSVEHALAQLSRGQPAPSIRTSCTAGSRSPTSPRSAGPWAPASSTPSASLRRRPGSPRASTTPRSRRSWATSGAVPERRPPDRRAVLRRRAVAVLLARRGARRRHRRCGAGPVGRREGTASTEPGTESVISTASTAPATTQAQPPTQTHATAPSGNPRHDRVGGRHGARLELRDAARARSRVARRGRGPIRGADFAFVNLEEVLSTRRGVQVRAGGGQLLRLPRAAAYARLLRSAGFDIVNMANNHALRLRAARACADRGGATARRSPRRARPARSRCSTAKGTRVAFLGFAPYPWAARLDRIPQAVALVRAARDAPTSSSSRSTPAPRASPRARAEGQRVLPRREPRQLAALRARRRRRRRRPRRRLRPARAARHREYRGHLIAYSLGNFAGLPQLRARRHAEPRRHLARDADPGRHLGAARLIPVFLHGAGLPALDPSNASVRLVTQLSSEDFGANAARFAPTGSWRTNSGLVGSTRVLDADPASEVVRATGRPPLRRSNEGDRKTPASLPLEGRAVR